MLTRRLQKHEIYESSTTKLITKPADLISQLINVGTDLLIDCGDDPICGCVLSSVAAALPFLSMAWLLVPSAGTGVLAIACWARPA